MGVIEWAIIATLGLLVACLRKLLTDELKAYMPSLIDAMLALAVRGVPPALRDRYREEWQAHLNELPGDLTKLSVAIGFAWAARRMKPPTREPATNPDEKSDEEIRIELVRELTFQDLETLVNSPSYPKCPDPWPPFCEGTSDGQHELHGSLYPSNRFSGAYTFQGHCSICGVWVDTGEIFDC